MDQKQLKRNLNYFTKTDTLLYVGIGLVAVGVILFFFGIGYLSYIIASVFAPVGIVLLLIGASQRVTDADIDTCITKLTEGMAVDTVENPKFAKRMQKQIPVLQIQSYMLKECRYYKATKSGAVRSEQFTSAMLYALDTELYIVCRRISLLEQEPETEIIHVPYSEIADFEILHQQQSVTLGKKTRTVNTTYLCILKENDRLQFPMQDNADVNEFILRTKRVIATQNASNQ